MSKEIKNMAASIKAKLLNYAKAEGIAFNRILNYYFQERFLYRVSVSPYQKQLILKGGALLLSLNINKGRLTQDINFLAKLETLDHSTATKMIREISVIDATDGVSFDPKSVKCTNIREDGRVNALRVNFMAKLGSAKGAMQVDIGYKDKAIPKPISFQYPTLLDLPAPQLTAYCWETVIAEKFEAMVKLYTLNSRLKDFYDILYLARQQNFNGKRLQKAIQGTFQKRELNLESASVVFREDFKKDEIKKVQWQAFLRKTGLEFKEDFPKVLTSIEKFLKPVTQAIAKGETFNKNWNATEFGWIG